MTIGFRQRRKADSSAQYLTRVAKGISGLKATRRR